jgi:hypothetical protein
MTDRELLKLAAKADGRDIGCRGCGKFGCVGECEWNPLTDDGTALRLAVKLGMDVIVYSNRTIAGNSPANDWQEPHMSDPYAATRRAIVRAAAEIGRGPTC